MLRSKALMAVLGLCFAMTATGCVTSPTPGSVVGESVSGFTSLSGAPVRVKAFNFRTNQWDVVGTANATSSATAKAGTLCSNSPDLFYYTVPYTITSDHLGPNSPDRSVKLQVTAAYSTGGEQTLYSSKKPNAVGCVLGGVVPGCNFYTLSYTTCGFNEPELNLYIIG
jgi:hypothetical protein